MKYRNMYRWRILPLLFVTVVGVLLAGSACATPTPVSISAPTEPVPLDAEFTVDIVVEPEVAIAGAQFDLSFDPSVITLISVDEGDLFNQGGCGTFFLEGTTITTDSNKETITGVVCVITTPGCAVSDPGTLATITFIAGEATGTSPLQLSNVRLGNKQGHAVTKEVNDGSVTVSDGS